MKDNIRAAKAAERAARHAALAATQASDANDVARELRRETDPATIAERVALVAAYARRAWLCAQAADEELVESQGATNLCGDANDKLLAQIFVESARRSASAAGKCADRAKTIAAAAADVSATRLRAAAGGGQ